MSMNPTLALVYNTLGARDAAQREQAKIAHMDGFAKAAAANKIDLSTLDAPTLNQLYADYSTKLAEEGHENPFAEHEGEGGEKKDEEKKDEEKKDEEGSEEEKKEAQAQFLALQDWQQKLAQADFLGRKMYHAFRDEERQVKTAEKTAGVRTPAPTATPPKVASAQPPVQQPQLQPATAFDVQAARVAYKLASAPETGLNGDAVRDRLNSLLTLGVPPMSKTASVSLNGSYDQAKNVRALELLEAIGVNVDWSKV